MTEDTKTFFPNANDTEGRGVTLNMERIQNMKELRQSASLHHAIDALWRSLMPAPRKLRNRRKRKTNGGDAGAGREIQGRETRALDSSIVQFLQCVRLAFFKDDSAESALSGAMVDLSFLISASLPLLKE